MPKEPNKNCKEIAKLYVLGKPIKEIAKILNISPNMVSQNIRKSKETKAQIFKYRYEGCVESGN